MTSDTDPAAPQERIPTFEEARQWSLVLDSQGIPNTIVPSGPGWAVIVDAADADRTAAELRTWYSENLANTSTAVETGPAREGAPPLWPAVVAALALVALLGAFHAWIAREADSAWYAVGTASAARMFWDEPWRALTALTLHADLTHVVSNIVFGGLFGSLVFMTLGPGVGAWLVILSGAAGNLLNAGTRGPAYDGLGASTAVFAAVGILAGYQFLKLGRSYRAWAPVFAAIMLLALYGMGPETDVLAHLWGFACGLVAGAVAARLGLAQVGPRLQWLLYAGLLVTVVGTWLVALGRV